MVVILRFVIFIIFLLALIYFKKNESNFCFISALTKLSKQM